MTPVTFASSFGWYHAAGGRCGIVLCPAQGHEDLCTHKALRIMADAFAEHGYPALRFDYAGTGDSLGDDREPERVEAWIASIEAAVFWLRANAQVDKIVLVGLRLGGALAALAAERLGTVSGLILLAPVVSGRAYIREISALSGLIRKHEDGDKAAAELDIGGFVITAETVKEITTIDLTTFRKAPVSDVLVVAIETQSSADKLAKSWTGLGVKVERLVFSHYGEFMIDPAFSRFPAEALRQSLGWLATHFDPAPQAEGASQIAPFTPLGQDHFSETPVLFGGDRQLFGMMCAPKLAAYERPAVIYITEGANHHIGWGRLSVQTCRKLAEFGLVSLRIDIAAVGDSQEAEAGQQQILYRDGATKDVSAAVDWLESQGFHNVTLIGLCAGAHLAFHTALADPRIARIVMVNLQQFIWHQGDSLIVVLRETYRSNSFYLRQLLVLDTWRRLARGEVNALGILRTLKARLRKKATATFLSLSNWWDARTNSEILRIKDWMKCLDQRQVQQCYVFSLGDAGVHELSLFRPLRRSRRWPYFSIAFIKDADHILSQREARDAFMDILQRMLCQTPGKIPGSAAGAASIAIQTQPSEGPVESQILS
jgi:dienelactone hydrolase